MEISHAYDDIIHLPHHVSAERPQMPLIARAAQFAPFAALTGYDAEIAETARLTEQKRELSEDERAEIGDALNQLMDQIRKHPQVSATFFVPDARKTGGQTVTLREAAKKMDPIAGTLTLAEGTVIPFENLYALRMEKENADGQTEEDEKR